ncbi:hypothetical protein pf16_149 [Pseudomonas phage pf16]|uniref:Toprim domain-containing protein n=1 Tax=Pseudomonas phage pf16 TaxID=1815630 RepID=A0A1S5R3S7_9CAUD|nr:hypothetical protein FDG98_gp149 [Pseudomonas phage pf16]AND75072.1 hypothetical protein pf16_149 [Pseudomonas phage pf16]
MIKHLLSRHYDPSRYKHQTIDEFNRILTVDLHNLSGRMVGFQQYRPDVTDKSIDNDPMRGRYCTIAPRDTTAVWGLETLSYSKRDLYVVEGIFKASTLHMLGHNAIAVLTCNPLKMQSWLWILRQQFNVIGIGDNDKAGLKLVQLVGGFQCDDLDEMPLEAAYQLVRLKTFGFSLK